MPSKLRSDKNDEVYNVRIDMIIERLKKTRALNIDPSLIGIDRYILKRLSFNRLNILTKAL